MYPKLHNLNMTLDVRNHEKRTCSTRRRRDKSTQTYRIARWHTNIYIKRTSLHLNTSRTSTTRLHGGHHSGVNSQVWETVTCHHRASSHNHDHNATYNDDSTITTIDFPDTIVVATSEDKHLAPWYHNFLRATPNVKLSIKSHNGNTTHSALRTKTTTNV